MGFAESLSLAALELNDPIVLTCLSIDLVVNDGIRVETTGLEDFPPPWRVLDKAIEESSILGNVEVEGLGVGLSDASKSEGVEDLLLAISDFFNPGLD